MSAMCYPESPSGDRIISELLANLDMGFASLVDVFQKPMYRLAYRVVGSPSDAEDITAEALLRSYRALRTYSPHRISELRIEPWIYRITLNTTRTFAARSLRMVGSYSLDAMESDPASNHCDRDRLSESQDAAMLLAQLTPVQREVVVLRYVMDLSVREVAEVLQCNESTVRSHGLRALRRMKGSCDVEG